MAAPSVYSVEDQWSAVLDRGGRVDFFGSRFDVPTQRRFGDIEAIQRYVAAVLADPRVRERHPDAATVSVRERAGQSKAHYEVATSTIAIPLGTQWAARESVILHEVAHHLSGAASAADGRRYWHGPRFRSVLCDLVAVILGEPAALLLRAGYEEAGLPVAAPQPGGDVT